ncbi:MAG: hypothetical protein AAB300_03460, partial [Nitrospirota bacterium]
RPHNSRFILGGVGSRRLTASLGCSQFLGEEILGRWVLFHGHAKFVRERFAGSAKPVHSHGKSPLALVFAEKGLRRLSVPSLLLWKAGCDAGLGNRPRSSSYTFRLHGGDLWQVKL